MSRHRHLDLGREHAHPLDLDHLLVASEIVHEALVVDTSVVAGVEPSVDELTSGGFLVAPVATRDRRAADDDLARLAHGHRCLRAEFDDGDVGSRHGQAAENGLGTQVHVVCVQPVGARVHRVRLRHAVGGLTKHTAVRDGSRP